MLIALGTPLREVLQRPALFVSHSTYRVSKSPDFFYFGFLILFLCTLFSKSLKLWLIYSGTLVISSALLLGFASLILALFSKIRFRQPLLLSLSFLQLSRQKFQSLLLMLSLGFSLYVVFTLSGVAWALFQQSQMGLKQEAPNLLLLNLKTNDPALLEPRLRDFGPQWISTFSARILKVKNQNLLEDEALQSDTYNDKEDENRYKTREYIISSTTQLSAGESLYRSAQLFSNAPASQKIRLSLEKNLAQTLGLKIGDELTLQISGLPVIGQIQSLRSVDWFRFEPHFLLLAHSEDIQDLPVNKIVTLRVPPGQLQSLQSQMVQKFPYLTPLNSFYLGERLQHILKQISWIAGSALLIVLICGFLVYLSIILSQRSRKYSEESYLKYSGLAPTQLAALRALECLWTALFVVCVPLVLASASYALLCNYVLNIQVQWPQAQQLGLLMLLLVLFISIFSFLLLSWRTAASARQLSLEEF